MHQNSVRLVESLQDTEVIANVNERVNEAIGFIDCIISNTNGNNNNNDKVICKVKTTNIIA